MRGLTSNNKEEIKECLDLLIESGKNSGFIHESYDVDNVDNYTREWFAWANSFFGLFIDKIIKEYPELIF
jgi:meiotically up-regulated gene 157 (Mug157) protein